MSKWWERLRFGVVALQLALAGHLVAAKYNLDVHTYDVATGELLAEQHHHNLVTTAGLNLIRDLLNGDAPAGLGYFACGTGTTPPAVGDTTLTTEVSRQAFTKTTKANGQLQVSYYLSSTTANGHTLAEVGLFNDPSAGSLYAHALLSPTIAKTSAIQVVFTWTLTWS